MKIETYDDELLLLIHTFSALSLQLTKVTQQVSHRPIKCQLRAWSERGTKVNGSHHPTVLSTCPLHTIVGVGKRGENSLVHGDLIRQHSFGATLRFTGPVPANSRQ